MVCLVFENLFILTLFSLVADMFLINVGHANLLIVVPTILAIIYALNCYRENRDRIGGLVLGFIVGFMVMVIPVGLFAVTNAEQKAMDEQHLSKQKVYELVLKDISNDKDEVVVFADKMYDEDVSRIYEFAVSQGYSISNNENTIVLHKK